jgi:hypothetical protein
VDCELPSKGKDAVKLIFELMEYDGDTDIHSYSKDKDKAEQSDSKQGGLSASAEFMRLITVHQSVLEDL